MQIAASQRATPAWSEQRGGDDARMSWALSCTALVATLAALLHNGLFSDATPPLGNPA